MSENEKTGETNLDIDELIEIVAGAGDAKKHGPKVGRITSIKDAPDFVDVQPVTGKIVAGIPRLDPILQSVPVAWPGSAQGRITWGLAIGDKVELIPQGGDLSSWINSESEAPSTDQRTLSLSDVVALPQSPTSKANPLPSAAYLATAVTIFAAAELLLGDNGATLTVGLDTDPIPFHSDGLFLTWCSQVEAAINILAPGSVSPLIALIMYLGEIESTATKVKAK